VADTPQTTKQKCSYKHGEWSCPFDSEVGHDLCIFHLPIDQKKSEDFWRHLANYLLALCRLQGPRVEVHVAPDTPWVNAYQDSYLLNYYDFRRPQGKACFVGFRFPAMDAQHSLMSFTFGIPADFSNARFGGWANFISATFSASANFRDARFSGEAILFFATFSGTASFGDATFDGTANLAGATFNGEASFGSATFGGKADFNHATFSGPAHFPSTTFSGAACFLDTKFKGAANFRFATFGGEADFSNAEFNEPAYMLQTTAEALLDFTHARLRNRLLFDGASFGAAARVLLWDIDFVHGTSDVKMEEGHQKGQIIEPAGQVVFRDIAEGMNRVSFLHTDILTDRLLVRFANVKWNIDPEQFIFDARFAFCRDSTRWPEATGLPRNEIASLVPMFHAEQLGPSDETLEQREQRAAKMLADCVPLVMQDVERIAREIRLSYEKYGHYGDAGDFYIAEMDFRRKRTPWLRLRFPELTAERRWWRRGWKRFTGFLSSLGYRAALELYRLTSHYGESPTSAAFVLVVILCMTATVYLFTGFAFQGEPVRQTFIINPRHWTLPVLDYGKALLFALANVVPGYFKIQSDKFASTSAWTTAVSMVQAVFGIAALTLLLLAIRRRFRR
jgi:hypothetical protein